MPALNRSALPWHLPRPFDRDLLVFDVETTGANPRIHQIASFGALLLNRTTLDAVASMSTLVQATPEALARADPRSMEIHGIAPSRLATAPAAGEVVARFLDTFGTNFYFCGWNICFDTQFLAALFEQAGRRQDFDAFRYHRLDLWSLVELAWLRGLIPDPPESLSRVCHVFGLQRQHVHDSLEDSRIAAEVLRKTLEMLVGGPDEGTIEPHRVSTDDLL